MISFTLLAATAVVTLALFTVLCVVAVRPAELQPVGADPYATPPPADSATDTMAGPSSEATLVGDWNEIELTRLCDVEDLLDSLEARNVRQQELKVVGNEKFVVRWR